MVGEEPEGWLRIGEELLLPEGELRFVTDRSGGPGGQHVNKVSTRVTLLFNVAESPSLKPEQRQLIVAKLSNRISKDGVLRVTSQKSRSQAVNRETAVARFIELLSRALARQVERKPTRPSAAARARRRGDKIHRSRLKGLRGKSDDLGE